MLEISDLSVSAGAFQLRPLSLAVSAGTCHALLGPSGAGKSTLLKAVLGLLPVESGIIRLAGKEITTLPIEKRCLGYVPQQLALFPHLTVRANLAYGARARRIPPEQQGPFLDQLVRSTGIGHLLDRFPATLSGGERQRVGLVRALASQPRMVLLDEPFTGLNEMLRRELWRLIRGIQRELALTVLLVTHDLSEAYYLSDQVSIMLSGRIVQQGETATVYSRPAGTDVAQFLGVDNIQPGRILDVRDGLATVSVGTACLMGVCPPDVSGDVLVSIRGEDVILLRPGHEVSSARNRLAARVVAVHPQQPLTKVDLDAGFPLCAWITRPACEELEIRPGARLTAMIKAPSVHLISRTA